jgi:hypothetical protein
MHHSTSLLLNNNPIERKEPEAMQTIAKPIVGSLSIFVFITKKKTARTIRAINPVNLSRKTLANDWEWELICLPSK